ncbi:hypothetical protein CPC08DRAFT_687339 [Agrocybe pediades]|nr:hypothetical protein CPC08DRAFT_687339 [Agrocybe pediades]
MMASLSDQIDRLARTTRAIQATAATIAPPSQSSGPFTSAVLTTHLSDLIRDVDPSELGLFRLVNNPSDNSYERDGRGPQVRRTEFPGATPLKKHVSRRDEVRDVEPEVYAHAALKYIERYEPIRPMPRAYDQIVTILERLELVRSNIQSLNATLEKVSTAEKVAPTKVRVEQEEQKIKDLQARVAELAQKKESHQASVQLPKKKLEQQQPVKVLAPPSPVSSPQEDKFWGAPAEPSRVLRFTDNLLDEEVNLGDVSSASFGSPLPGGSEFKPLKLFADIAVSDDDDSVEPTVASFAQSPRTKELIVEDEPDETHPEPIYSKSLSSQEGTSQAVTPVSMVSTNEQDTGDTARTNPREKKPKVDEEVQRIVSKIWLTMADILPPPSHTSTSAADPLAADETLSYLRTLSTQTPAPESPIASTVSSVTGDGTNAPTFQQIQIAFLLMLLLSASPHYSMPLNDVKENLTHKAKSSGVTVAGQSATKVLYTCIAKRLLRIDRGGRAQIVKFDI